MTIAIGLSGELVDKIDELERADGTSVAALAQVAELENVIRVFRSKCVSDDETAVLKEI